jgi:glycosyltransferase involved in cell wall biosynthesis
MHVLYFHQHFTTPNGFGGTRSYELARQLITSGHQVTMVCGSNKNSQSGLQGEFSHGRRVGIVDGIKIIELALPYSNYDSFFKRTIKFLRFAYHGVKIALSYDYDLVVAITTPLTAGIPGIFAKVLRKKPFVFEVADLWPELPKAMGVIKNPLILKLIDILESVSYKAADACIGLSPGIVAGIKRKVGTKKKVILLPNGCDLKFFDEKPQPLKLPAGIKSGDFVALFAGAHGIANGLDAILNVANKLQEMQRNDIKFLFVGDGKLKPYLQQRAQSEGLDNCIFINPISKRDIPRLFAAVNVGLMVLANVPAFYYGTSPNKFFDYIASGLPVVNNYPGWLTDMILEHSCGIAVPPDDVYGFAIALVKLADDKELVNVYGSNARKLAMNFARDKLAKQFEVFLTSVK